MVTHDEVFRLNDLFQFFSHHELVSVGQPHNQTTIVHRSMHLNVVWVDNELVPNQTALH